VAYQIVTFTATDQCNRSTTCTALVVMVDQTAPEIEGTINNQIVECDDNILLYYDKWIDANLNQLSATDACGEVTWSYETLAPNRTCNGVIAHTLVRFIVRDDCGNTNELVGKFGIKNQHPATFATTLEDQNIPCGTVPVFDTPNYVHACGEAELTYEDEMISGTCAGVAAIVRTWTVVDLCDGKTATISQRINFEGTSDLVNLRFRLAEAGAVKIAIYNLQGKVMASIAGNRPLGQQQEIVDTSTYPEGSYIVMVQHHGQWLSRQFVKIDR